MTHLTSIVEEYATELETQASAAIHKYRSEALARDAHRDLFERRDRTRHALNNATIGRHRIRHCDGNKAAWMLIGLRPDGTEIDVAHCVKTSMSVATLIERLQPGCVVELVT